MSDDPRIGSILKSGDTGDVVLLGYPCDEGVRRNGGRVGAKDGPAHVRKHLAKMGTVVNPELGIDLNDITLSDAGDVAVVAGDLKATHKELRARVSALIASGAVPFVIGGGNDQSYPNAAALLDAMPSAKLGVINIDAHLDVRPLHANDEPHSGSPFRQLLEDERFDGHHFVEFAAQGNQCSAEHVAYLHRKKASIAWFSQLASSSKPVVESFNVQLDNLAQSCSDVFVSFDIDSIAGADCPGVSCVATYGLTAWDALQIAFAAGRHEKVSLFDVSEFNPAVEDHRTARLVVNMFYYFACGVATRKSQHGRARI